nr:tetratricopeptide repeat protein [uncultured Rhodopila sp.]
MQSIADPLAVQPAPDRSAYRLGLLALRDGDLFTAVALLRRAVGANPHDAGIRRNLVRALLAGGQFVEVLAEASRALVLAPDNGELYYALGTALNGVGRPARACAAFNRAIAINPDHAPTWLNFGNAATDMDDLESAEALYRTALRVDPELPEAHASLGYLLTRLGRLEEATRSCETAIRLRPEFARAHMNLATALLLGGDLNRGFAEYEWRKRDERYRRDFPPPDGPVWDGSDPHGRTILIRAEQGLGDAIQCARYLRLIRDAGGTPVLVCAAALVPLIASMDGVLAVAAGDPLPPYDARADLMSLPAAFGTTMDSIPLAEGYLSADPARIGAWNARLPPGRKAGLIFAGNPAHPDDRRRSIPPELADALPAIPGLNFVNLQHGQAAGTLALPDLTAWMTDYAETAALVANLDVVVTVDTSIAHLAGALGTPALVLLPFAPDWRWMLGRNDSPWYRSLRLFRQSRAGDWSSVMAEVMGLLASGGYAASISATRPSAAIPPKNVPSARSSCRQTIP